MTLAKNIIDQKAIKKTNTNIRNPRNFIIINFATKKQQELKLSKHFRYELQNRKRHNGGRKSSCRKILGSTN